jgi:hypothetical protein
MKVGQSSTISLDEAKNVTVYKNPQIVEEIKKRRGGVVFVNGVNGNDNNVGAARGAAFKTIKAAIDSGAATILIKEGTYAPFSLANVSNITLSIDHYYDVFTDGTNEGYHKVIIDGERNNNDGIRLTDCQNINIYGFEVKNCINNGLYILQCEAIKIYDTFIHDIYPANMDAACQGARLNKSDTDFYNCIVYNIGTNTAGTGAYHCDGFNIHDTGDVNLYNCKAYNCEDDGVSHHDACTGVIDGGEWFNCGKGGIASPTYAARVNIKNAYCHDNLRNGIYIYDDGSTDRGNILISDCVLKNNGEKDITVSSNYNVIMINCIFDTSEGSTITVFNQNGV